MKTKAPETLASLNRNKGLILSQNVLESSQLSLIECLLDVPESRLENYISKNDVNYVSTVTSKVLKVKKETSFVLESILKKIKA